jgi:single-stranded-DNA-specific exonuclease
MYDLLAKLAPYGIGNPNPIFLLQDMTVMNIRLVGQDKQHVQIDVQSEGQLGTPIILKGIGFRLGHLVEDIYVNDSVNIMCRIEVNEWNDQRNLQLHILDMKRSEKSSLGG